MYDVLNLCCRNKTGILGWRSEKTETVNGYEAKVEHRLLRQLSDLSHCPETTAVRAQFDISWKSTSPEEFNFQNESSHLKTFPLDF